MAIVHREPFGDKQALLVVDADPNGSISEDAGSVAFAEDGSASWQCLGGSVWEQRSPPPDDSVSDAMLEEMPANTIKARFGSSPNNPGNLAVGNGEIPLRPAGANLKSGTGAEAAEIIGSRVNAAEASLPTLAIGQYGFATDTQRTFVGTSTGNLLLAGNHSCSAYPSAAQTLANGYGVVALDAEEFKSDADMHDNATNNTRVYARFDGVYEVKGRLTYSSSATGLRAIRFDVSGSFHTVIFFAALTVENGLQTSKLIRLNAGDYVEMYGYQSSGGPLGLITGNSRNWLSLAWRSPL